MFGLGKKKQDEDGKSEKGEISLDKKKKNLDRNQGPAWASIVLLLLSVLAGLFFWFYGKLATGGFVGASFRDSFFPVNEQGQPDLSQDGVIIFEK